MRSNEKSYGRILDVGVPQPVFDKGQISAGGAASLVSAAQPPRGALAKRKASKLSG